jgi:methyltransferase (TIGR00027 family)
MSEPSVSALNVARSRAVAAHDPRPELRGPDHLAEVFLGEAAIASLADPAIVSLLISKMDAVSPGGYAFFLARTAWLDGVLGEALASGVRQVLALGAGYDTRALRFASRLGSTRVFEVDLPATQAHKRGLLDAAGIEAPPGLVYVPVDLRTDALGDALAAAGYDPTARTLVLWDGSATTCRRPRWTRRWRSRTRRPGPAAGPAST